MIRNMALLEAIDNKSPDKIDVPGIVAAMKKSMNTCKLTKFKSESSCAQFFGMFFLSSVGDVSPNMSQWSTIYTDLLSNDVFCQDLARYMVGYKPSSYMGIFAPLWNRFQLELTEMKKDRVRYISLMKAFFTTLQTRMDGVGEIVRTQVNDAEVLKFVTTTNMTLSQFIMDMSKMIQDEVTKATDPDDIVIYNRIHENKLSEDTIELIGILREAAEFYDETNQTLTEAAMVSDVKDTEEPVDEGIVRNAAMKAKEAAVKIKKAERDFDQLVMRKVRKMREERRNRKHSEMVGEALAINHEIKRLLKSGGWFIINPALGVIRYFGSLIMDKATDRQDRAVLIRQIKEEIEIVEEKIRMAENKGDDKARIELIRARQKMVKEYERITKIRYDANRRNQMSAMS